MARLISAKRQPEFDRDAQFVAIRPVTARAREYRKGDPFDKTGVTVRTLRALYDQRKIAMAGMMAARGPAPPRPTSMRAVEMFDLAQQQAAEVARLRAWAPPDDSDAYAGPREPAAPIGEPPEPDADEERNPSPDDQPDPPSELIVKRGGAGGGYGVYRGDERIAGPLSKAKAYERLDALRKAEKRASRRAASPERQPAA